MSDTLWPHGLYSSWNSPGQNTGVGSLSLLQGIFPTQGSNPSLLHCRQILYQLSHQWNPRIPEWVTYAFSSRSSRPRNWIRVSCIASGFFTSWATREAPTLPLLISISVQFAKSFTIYIHYDSQSQELGETTRHSVSHFNSRRHSGSDALQPHVWSLRVSAFISFEPWVLHS